MAYSEEIANEILGDVEIVRNIIWCFSYPLQVILCNMGDIDAVFKLLPSDTQFGPQFSFLPAQGIVIPGGYQAIQVRVVLYNSFTKNTLS